MPDEAARRRADFRRGTPIRLADGREWTFPDPPPPASPRSGEPAEASGGGPPPGAEYAALLEAIADAEDEAERLRAELALAIYLLSRNYDLGAGDFRALLEAPDRSSLAEMQRAFRGVAAHHLRGARPRDRRAGVRGGRRRDALIQRLPFLKRRPANQAT